MTAHQKERESSGEKDKSRSRSGLRKPWTAEEQKREDAFIQECTEALKRQAERDRMLNKEKLVLRTPVLKIPSSEESNTQCQPNVEEKMQTSPPFEVQADSSDVEKDTDEILGTCLLYTSPSPRDRQKSRMPSSA